MDASRAPLMRSCRLSAVPNVRFWDRLASRPMAELGRIEPFDFE